MIYLGLFITFYAVTLHLPRTEYVTQCQKSEKRNSYVLKIKFCNFKEW